YAARRLADRGPGYGVAAEVVDGNDPDAMALVCGRAIERARRGGGPTLIEAMLGRMRGHAEGDGSLKVVPEDELARYVAGDPVPAYAARLERDGVLSADLRARIEKRVAELVEKSIEAALAAEEPDPATAMRPVFAASPPSSPDPSPPVEGGEGRPRPALSSPTPSAPSPAGEAAEEGEPAAMAAFTGAVAGGKRAGEVTYLDAIQQALREEMERDPAVVLLGQDIAVFEGAFRATRGLHARWPERVLDTPIAESGALGLAAGAALLGFRPVVEMQFADFVSNGFNQLVNVLAKLFYRFEVPCPVVVRLPSGGGVGAGPFHSQNPEVWFTQHAGLKVVCPATARDAKALLKAAIRDPNPVIFCEHKFLYRRIKEVLPAGDLVGALGQARVARQGSDLSLIGYGAATWTCLEAAEELGQAGISAEVVDLRTLIPYDEETVAASVRKTGRCVIVHEPQITMGFGAEIAARLSDAAFAWLDAPIRRVAYPDRPVPYAKTLEKALLPAREQVVAAAREILAF
ncbi:MAG TPA: transketolase C-terminal domain-containing protein, partial [Thermoanaerobaculia bacterium]|nr:transketolase C-terminal domain-containing protein [Thermoanaerobaculia bacterium]